MDRRDARLALDLARRWTQEGLMPPASLRTLEQRHSSDARDDPQAESFGSGILYALGGVLLGCVVFALYVLLEDNGAFGDDYDRSATIAAFLFLGWGLVCSAGAFTIDLVARKPRLGDAFHVAALVAITASGVPQADDLPLGFLGIAFAAAILWYRRTSFMAAFLALIALNVSLAIVLFGQLDDESASFAVWFGYAIAQLPLLAFASRRAGWPWPATSLAAATFLLAATFLGLYFAELEQVLPGFDGDVEVYLAVLMGAALAAGLALREKGLVLAAALVVAIVAIVFAFDVGELIGGLLALLAVAGLLLWQAGALRRYLKED